MILAAALYDSHRFPEIEELPETLVRAARRGPHASHPDDTGHGLQHFGAGTGAVSGGAGWEELFRRSQDILREWDPIGPPADLVLPRTWPAPPRAAERGGAVISQIEEQPGLNDLSRWSLRFLQAEHARQRGERWISEEMEIIRQEGHSVGHPFGFYYQATARQPGRTSDDSVERFRRASELFSKDPPTMVLPTSGISCPTA